MSVTMSKYSLYLVYVYIDPFHFAFAFELWYQNRSTVSLSHSVSAPWCIANAVNNTTVTSIAYKIMQYRFAFENMTFYYIISPHICQGKFCIAQQTSTCSCYEWGKLLIMADIVYSALHASLSTLFSIWLLYFFSHRCSSDLSFTASTATQQKANR